MKSVVVLAALVAACPHPGTAPSSDVDASCTAIAADVEALRPRFPALVEFRASSAMQRDCRIEYGFHTRHPTGRGGGWTAQVPAPDPDGVWLYIGLYDPHGPEANDQINTQPVLPDWWVGSRKVTLLIQEGADTRGLGDAIVDVLHRHGMTGATPRRD